MENFFTSDSPSITGDSTNDDSINKNPVVSDGSTSDSEEVPSSVQLVSISLSNSTVMLEVGESTQLTVTGTLSDNSTVSGTQNLQVGDDDESIIWFANNPTVATIDNGLVTAVASGSGAVLVHAGNLSATVSVVVSESTQTDGDQNTEDDSVSIPKIKLPYSPTDIIASRLGKIAQGGSSSGSAYVPDVQKIEAPTDLAEAFLGSDDDLTIDYGINAGYGAHLFPEILYGLPQNGGTHVVSLGSGGSLVIELHGYVVVDGPGVDFTIFENPIISSYYGHFQERAQVSVSEDGLNYYSYKCDAFDKNQIYKGCAGVNPVNALSNPLDPTVSGGDSFDLGQVKLARINYIRITDLQTCTPTDPTYYTASGSVLCAISGQEGFDLDAVAIVNGVNE